MQTITAIIVDDEPAGRSSLRALLLQVAPFVKVVGEAASAVEAIQHINAHAPQLVFLDVAMPGQDGFHLLAAFDEPAFDVIFVTAHEGYALRALKMAATDYLLKPLHEDDLLAAVQKVAKKGRQPRPGLPKELYDLLKNREPDRIAVPDQEGIRYLRIQDIVRCEAAGSYTVFHLTAAAKITSSRTLADYEELLEPHGFFRVHYSHLINARRVEKYRKGRGGSVLMSDGAEIEVSARRKEAFLQKMAQLGH
jgi:two-component system, LytTR family, response regulator